MGEDVPLELSGKAFYYWGAFGFSVTLLLGIIVWLLRFNKDQRAAFQAVIDDLNQERRYWVDTAFEGMRETNQQSLASLEQVTRAVNQTEKLVNLLKQLPGSQ